MSVRKSQRAALRQMLNFNAPPSSDSKNVSFNWKVLVYDDACRDVISPLLNIQQLRDQGVTLHLSLNAKRETIADVPAVYFCMPTKENILQIAQDVCQSRYKAFYLNFAIRIPRPLLELLAKTTQKAGCAHKIAKVFDQHQSFVSLEDRLFVLEQERVFVRYNQPGATEAEMEATMGGVVEGLFAALATMQNIPVIRAPKGGAAHMVAAQLNARIRTNLEGDGSVFSRSVLEDDTSVFGTGTRPVVVVLDRNFDQASGLRHGNTYQALVHDMLAYSSNRVTISESDGTRTAYLLDVDTDDFWAKNACKLFSEVIPASKEQLAVVTAKEEAVRSRGGAGGDDDSDEIFDNVKALPEVMRLKKQIKQHTDVLTAAMEHIMKRNIPKFIDMEDAICSNPDVLPKGLRELLRVPDDPADLPGQVEDRLRLLAVTALESHASELDALLEDVEKDMLTSLLPAPAPSPASSTEPEAEAAASASPDAAAAPPKDTAESTLAKCVFAYLRQQRSITKMRSKQMAAKADKPNQKGTPSKSLADAFGFVKGLGDSVLKGVKKMHQSYLPESTSPLRTTQAISAICEAKVSLSDQFVSFDPKRGAGPLTDAGGPGKPHLAVVVFVIGPGNVREYQELLAWAKESEVPRKLIYGCTSLLKPRQFLQEIAVLGGAALSEP